MPLSARARGVFSFSESTGPQAHAAHFNAVKCSKCLHLESGDVGDARNMISSYQCSSWFGHVPVLRGFAQRFDQCGTSRAVNNPLRIKQRISHYHSASGVGGKRMSVIWRCLCDVLASRSEHPRHESNITLYALERPGVSELNTAERILRYSLPSLPPLALVPKRNFEAILCKQLHLCCYTFQASEEGKQIGLEQQMMLQSLQGIHEVFGSGRAKFGRAIS